MEHYHYHDDGARVPSQGRIIFDGANLADKRIPRGEAVEARQILKLLLEIREVEQVETKQRISILLCGHL